MCRYQTRDNYLYNHDFLGCTVSYQKDQFLLRCEVKENPERYEEEFFKNGILQMKVVNKGKFPTETEKMEKKMFFFQNKIKKKNA